MSNFILNRGKTFGEKYKNLKDEHMKQFQNPSAKKQEECAGENKIPKKNIDEDVKGKVDLVKSQSLITLDSDSLDSLTDLSDEEYIVASNQAIDPSARTTRSNNMVGSDNSKNEFEVSFDSEEVIDERPKDIVIKLVYEGHIYRYTMGYDDHFKDHRKALYKLLQVNKRSHKLIMSFKNRFLTYNETPGELGLTVVDIIECYTKQAAMKANNAEPRKVHRPNTIRIKFRNNKDGKNTAPTVCDAVKDEPLKIVMNEYSQKCGYPMEKLVFEFDGEKLCGEEAPNDLDMEDNSLIDVVIRELS